MNFLTTTFQGTVERSYTLTVNIMTPCEVSLTIVSIQGRNFNVISERLGEHRQNFNVFVKFRPNDRNMPTQHRNIVGRNIFRRNIVGRNMLCVFGHPVAVCCDVLVVVSSNLTLFNLEPTTPNMLQHIATRWPNARNMLRATVLQYVALTCCDRLAGA